MSKSFLRFSWITLVFIYLVVIAGSIVRSTGSGMGCPDWPKCFDQVIPPTDISQLPENYKEIYLEKRKAKVKKFTALLDKIGLSTVAEKVRNDKTLYKEQNFNWKNTWTEYGNRLVGFVAGNMVLISLIWVIFKFRQNKKLLLLCFANLIFIGFEGWLGAMVVATNLVPWVLTIHMVFALVIIWIQIKIIHLCQVKKSTPPIPPLFKRLYYFAIILTIIQILLGVQVRQEIDFLVQDDIDRGEWIGNMDLDFYFHRSFSWVVLIVNLGLVWINRQKKLGVILLNYVIILIIIEFITGVLFSYANMPWLKKLTNLLIANLLLGIQIYGLKYFRYYRESLIR